MFDTPFKVRAVSQILIKVNKFINTTQHFHNILLFFLSIEGFFIFFATYSVFLILMKIITKLLETMMIRAFFTSFCLVLICLVKAQTPEFKAPDYALIQKNIEDKNSEFYYPALLKRLKQNDTLLTDSQYRHLYFGYTFRKEYKPYKISKKMEEMGKYYRAEDISEKDMIKGIRLFHEALEENPLNLRAMNYLAYMYHLTHDDSTAKKISRNVHGLLGAILSSGDGLKCETGFHVICVSDEYVVLNIFQMELKSQAYTGECDYMEFEKDQYKVPGLYFNINRFQGKMFD